MQAQDPRTPWMDAADELGHVLKAQKGDRKEFLALLRHYHRSIYRLAFTLTRDARAAVVITRAASLKAKEGVRYMAEGQRFFPWIAAIVMNLARGRHRLAVSEGSPVGVTAASPGVVDVAKRLLATMDQMEPDAQAAVALRIVELLPYPLIETALRLKPAGAQALLAEARSRLTAQLGAGGGA